MAISLKVDSGTVVYEMSSQSKLPKPKINQSLLLCENILGTPIYPKPNSCKERKMR